MNYTEKIEKAKHLIDNSDYIIIGAGSGLSTAGGFVYSGENFDRYFKDFGDKYGFKDMYSGGFYPYKTQEEKWAYWSRYIFVNRYKSEKPNKVYTALFNLVKNKDYFVITTNVDHQFQIAGFDKNRLFYTQGDYGLFQCSTPCHNKTYDNKDIVLKMLKSQNFITEKNGKMEITNSSCWKMTIDNTLIPKCPICGENMEMNLRSDDRFVQDEQWHRHAELYSKFINKANGKNVVLFEVGVGFNTPAIIRFPFENFVFNQNNFYLLRLNKDYAFCPKEIENKTILFDENIEKVLNDLKTIHN